MNINIYNIYIYLYIDIYVDIKPECEAGINVSA